MAIKKPTIDPDYLYSWQEVGQMMGWGYDNLYNFKFMRRRYGNKWFRLYMFKWKKNFWERWFINWADLYEMLIDWQSKLLTSQKKYKKKPEETFEVYNQRLRQWSIDLLNKMINYEKNKWTDIKDGTIKTNI